MTQPQYFEVVIALGTNLGNRSEHLWKALQRLPARGIQPLRHSSLFETSAAYVTAQPNFLNAAILARTALPPLELLAQLKAVEAEAGRDLHAGDLARWGPRPLDLDIIFYGDMDIDEPTLTVPHPRCHEREFVRQPVRELLYDRDMDPSRSRAGQAGAAGSWQHPHGAQARSKHHSSGHNTTRSSSDDITTSDSSSPSSDSSSSPSSSSSSSSPSSPSSPSPSSSSPRYGEEPKHRWALLGGRHWVLNKLVQYLISGAPDSKAQGGGSPRSPSHSDHTPTPYTPAEAAAVAASAARANGAARPQGGDAGGDVMRRVTPLRDGRVMQWDSGARLGSPLKPGTGSDTIVMGILNVTPDSFSDGRSNPVGDVDGAVACARRMVEAGAGLLDVGGQSTRPGAALVSAEDEAGRVLPVIRAIRQDRSMSHVPISIDTHYASVAAAAVEAGADVVNDISGGSMDPEMHSTVASLNVPYILMHMRGTPRTMQSPENTTYACVWREVGEELQRSAERAVAAGIPAWNIILDPGIGFSKTEEGNLRLIRELPKMRSMALQGVFRNSPVLMGPSRKGFLGRISGRKVAAERDACSIAASVVCALSGAQIVRAHDVQGHVDAMRIVAALQRVL
ncbi:MAG: hypothetical protein WDW38_008552 [Sanguina aurantia]